MIYLEKTMSYGRKRAVCLTTGFALLMILWHLEVYAADRENIYTGSDQCKSCHEKEYDSFNNSKMVHSYRSIALMKKGLSDAEFEKCFECHTTGYKKPGGFRSAQETPHLKNAGCEVCHGPGSRHAESADPKDIKGKLDAKDCESCHNPERVGTFKCRPMVYGGAH